MAVIETKFRQGYYVLNIEQVTRQETGFYRLFVDGYRMGDRKGKNTNNSKIIKLHKSVIVFRGEFRF
jgi:hypothetical protein